MLLSFSFNSPFDKNGEWETDYNDEGSFVALFEAGDGEFTEKFRIEITILNTNQAPEILSSFSEGKIVDIDEDESLDLDRLSYKYVIIEYKER